MVVGVHKSEIETEKLFSHLKTCKIHSCVYMVDVYKASTVAFLAKLTVEYFQEQILVAGSEVAACFCFLCGSPVSVS